MSFPVELTSIFFTSIYPGRYAKCLLQAYIYILLLELLLAFPGVRAEQPRRNRMGARLLGGGKALDGLHAVAWGPRCIERGVRAVLNWCGRELRLDRVSSNLHAPMTSAVRSEGGRKRQ